MKIGLKAIMKPYVMALAGLMMAHIAVAAAGPSTYNRTIMPVGNGWGISSIATTEPDPTNAYLSLYMSGSGICDAFTSGSVQKVNGAITDFGTNLQNVIGFNFTFAPATPDALTVTRNLLMGYQANGVTEIGYGGTGNSLNGRSAQLAVRVDGYGGTLTGNAVGTINFDSQMSSSTPLQLTSYDSLGNWTLLGGSTTAGNWSTPGFSQNQDMAVSSSFNMYLGRFHSSFAGSGADMAPHAVTLSSGDHRGSVAINDHPDANGQKWIAAAARDANGLQTLLRVIRYTFDGSTYAEVSNTTYSFANAFPGITCTFCNYHSSAAYRGPQQISINDRGDIVFPVELVTTGDGGNQRGILMMRHDEQGTFRIVVDNRDTASHPSIFFDPSAIYSPCLGGCAIDNDCNVYFPGANWVGNWNGSTTTTNCIFKASANNATTPTAWSVEPILWRGMEWKEGMSSSYPYMGTTTAVHQLSILTDGNSSEWLANPAAFCTQGINRTKLTGTDNYSGTAYPRYSVGGIELSGGIVIDGLTGGNVCRAMYYAPTKQIGMGTYMYGTTPTLTYGTGTCVKDANLLIDAEPVNILCAKITDYLGAQTVANTPPATGSSTYYWYAATDNGTDVIWFRTIWTGLSNGTVVNISGETSTIATTPITLTGGSTAQIPVGKRTIFSDGAIRLGTNSKTISGNITIKGVSSTNLYKVPVIITLWNQDFNQETTREVRVDTSGNYTLQVLPGRYKIGFRSPHFLQDVLGTSPSYTVVDCTTSNATGVNATLMNGDTDGNNRVNAADYTKLAAAMGSTPGSANWNASCDLDMNGRVNAADYSILVNADNWNKVGKKF